MQFWQRPHSSLWEKHAIYTISRAYIDRLFLEWMYQMYECWSYMQEVVTESSFRDLLLVNFTLSLTSFSSHSFVGPGHTCTGWGFNWLKFKWKSVTSGYFRVQIHFSMCSSRADRYNRQKDTRFPPPKNVSQIQWFLFHGLIMTWTQWCYILRCS